MQLNTFFPGSENTQAFTGFANDDENSETQIDDTAAAEYEEEGEGEGEQNAENGEVLFQTNFRTKADGQTQNDQQQAAPAGDAMTSAKEQYLSLATKSGIDIPADWEPNPDTYEDDYFKLVTESKLKTDNPLVYEIYKNNINPISYFESAMQLQEVNNMSDLELFVYNGAQEEVTLRINKGEFQNQEQVDAAFDEVTARLADEAKTVSPTVLNRLVVPIRKSVQDNLQDLPAVLKQREIQAQVSMAEREVEAVNNSVKESVEFLKGNWAAKGILPIQISDAEAKDFIGFYEQQLTSSKTETNDVQIPFFETLTQDPKELLSVMQLYYMYKKGGLQAIKSQIRASTIENVAPITFKSNSSTTVKPKGGPEVIDYSDPDWKKKVR